MAKTFLVLLLLEILNQELGESAYNRTKHLDQRRKMMQAWADYLDNLS